jgi:hypothetical protein
VHNTSQCEQKHITTAALQAAPTSRTSSPSRHCTRSKEAHSPNHSHALGTSASSSPSPSLPIRRQNRVEAARDPIPVPSLKSYRLQLSDPTSPPRHKTTLASSRYANPPRSRTRLDEVEKGRTEESVKSILGVAGVQELQLDQCWRLQKE